MKRMLYGMTLINFEEYNLKKYFYLQLNGIFSDRTNR